MKKVFYIAVAFLFVLTGCTSLPRNEMKTLCGCVYDEDDNPVAGAEIKAGSFAKSFTDNEGFFVIEDEKNNDRKIEVFKKGYVTDDICFVNEAFIKVKLLTYNYVCEEVLDDIQNGKLEDAERKIGTLKNCSSDRFYLLKSFIYYLHSNYKNAEIELNKIDKKNWSKDLYKYEDEIKKYID